MGDPDASVAGGSHVMAGPAAVLWDGDGEGALVDDGADETVGVGEGAGEHADRTRVAMSSICLIAAS
jgi:hypothetical protein